MLLDDFIRFLRTKKVLKYIPPGAILFDLGCGKDAHLLNLLKKKIKQGIGIDKKVLSREFDNLKLIKMDLRKQIPLANESVDYLTILAVLEHLDYPEEVLKECHRVLKTGGYLLITVPAPITDLVLNFLAYKLRIIDREELEDHKRYFPMPKIKEIIKNAGFSLIKAKKFELIFNFFILAKK